MVKPGRSSAGYWPPKEVLSTPSEHSPQNLLRSRRQKVFFFKKTKHYSPEVSAQKLSVSVRVWQRWNKCNPGGRHQVSASTFSLPIWLILKSQPEYTSPFRAPAGPGPSPSSVWRCSRTDSGPWWPASWLSGWGHGLVAVPAPRRQLASAETQTKPKKVRGLPSVKTMSHLRHASCRQRCRQPAETWK